MSTLQQHFSPACRPNGGYSIIALHGVTAVQGWQSTGHALDFQPHACILRDLYTRDDARRWALSILAHLSYYWPKQMATDYKCIYASPA